MASFEEIGAALKLEGVAAFEAGMQTAGKATFAFGEAVTTAGKTFDVFSSATEKITSSVEGLKGKFEPMKETIGSFGEKITEAGRHVLEFAEHSVTHAASELGHLASEAGGAVLEGIRKVGEVAAEAGKKLLEFGEHAAHALLHVGSESLQLAGDYEGSMNRVKFLTNASTEEMQEFNKASIEIGKTTIFSSKTAAEGLAQLAQMGYSSKDSILLNAEAADAAMVANVDLKTSISQMTTVFGAFGVSTQDSGKYLDMMVKSTQLGKLNFSEFSNEMSRVGAAAKLSNQSFANINAAMLAFTATGMPINQASTLMSGSLLSLAKPSKDAGAMIKKLGLDIYDSSGQMRPYSSIIGQLTTQTGQMTEQEKTYALATIFGRNNIKEITAAMEAKKTVMKDGNEVTLQGADLLKYYEDQINGSAGATKKAGEVLKQGFNYQMKQLKGSVEEAMISIGQGLLPTFTKIVGYVGNVVNKFIDMETETHVVQNVLKKVGEVITTVLEPVFIKLVEGIGSAYEAFPRLSSSIMPLVKNFITLVEALNPVHEILSILMGFIQGGVKGGFDALGETIVNVGAVFGLNLTGPVNAASGFIMTTLLPALGSIGEFITGTVVPALVSFGGFIVTNVLPALGQIGEFIFTTVLPAVMGFGNFLGSVFGPILVSLGNTFVTTILPALQQFGDFIMTNVVPALGQLFTWIGTNIVPIIQQFAMFIATQVIPILGQVAAFIITQVVPAVIKFAEGVASFLAPILERLGSFIQSVVIPALVSIGNFIQSVVIPALSNVFSYINANILPVFMQVASVLGNVVGVAMDVFSTLVGVVWNAVSTAIGVAWSIIQTIWNGMQSTIGGPLTAAFNIFKAVVGVVWSAISATISTTWSIIDGIFTTIGSAISGPLTTVFQTLQAAIGVVWDTISGAIKIAWTAISGTFTTIQNAVSGPLTTIWNDLQSAVGKVWDTITTAVSTAWDTISKTISDILTGIGNFVTGAIAKAGEIGSGIISGILNGLKNGAGQIISFIVGMAGNAVDAIKGFFGIHSPSLVFQEEVGKPLMQGWALGMSNNADLPQKALASAASLVLQGAISPAASAQQIYNSSTVNQSSNVSNFSPQYNLTTQSVRSTESVQGDFHMMMSAVGAV